MPIKSTVKPQILYVGNEPLLSRASAELLKGVGYRVRTTTPVNAANVFREGTFAAVILCATLSGHEAEELAAIVEEEVLRPPIISIHLGLLGDAPYSGSSIVVDALNGPEALINAVSAALGNNSVLLKAV